MYIHDSNWGKKISAGLERELGIRPGVSLDGARAVD